MNSNGSKINDYLLGKSEKYELGTSLVLEFFPLSGKHMGLLDSKSENPDLPYKLVYESINIPFDNNSQDRWKFEDIQKIPLGDILKMVKVVMSVSGLDELDSTIKGIDETN